MLKPKEMTEWDSHDTSSEGTDVLLLEDSNASDPEAFLLVESEAQLTGLARLRHLGEGVLEAARIKANQLIHGFGTDRFWHQMGNPRKVETSFGTGHMVRILSQCSRAERNEPDKQHVLIINPLGTSSAGGYMAEVANIFYEAGFVVWNVSPPGFEGNLPLSEVPKLTVQHETKYVDEALDLACQELGTERPVFHTFGGSQGGGLAVGMLYRDIERGREHGKTVAVTPSSGHNSGGVARALSYAGQFALVEPPAIAAHILGHPKGPLRRALQLAPSVNLSSGARKQMLGASFGLIFRPGHEAFLAKAALEELAPHFNHDQMVVICFTKDVVAQSHKWPATVTMPIVGSHMDVVDERYTRFAARFFQSDRPMPHRDSETAA